MDSIISQRSRMAIYRTDDPTITPTVPEDPGSWHKFWRDADLYDGELFLNTATNELWIRSGDNILKIIGQGITPGSILPSDTVTSIGDIETAGVSTLYSRGDHAHGYITPSTIGSGSNNGGTTAFTTVWNPVTNRWEIVTQTITTCLKLASPTSQNVLTLFE